MKTLLKSSSIFFLALGLGACGGGGSSDNTALPSDNASGTPAETRSFQSSVDTPALNYSGTTVYWDLETNSIVDESADWELKISSDGYGHTIQVNGGVSGTGSAGIGAILTDSPFEITDPTDLSQVYKYFEDSASGVLSTPGGYGPLEYNVAGSHKMWPNFATYVFEQNGIYYKAQVISNYGEDGTSPSATLRIRYAAAAENEPSSVTTLDAATDSTQAAYLDLANGNTVSSDQLWQMAYQKYVGFKTNGGISGEGNVSGCLAHSYSNLYDENGAPVQSEFESKTAENTLTEFNSVSSASCTEWLEDTATSQFTDWYTYDMSTHTITIHDDASNGWILRSATADTNGDYQYARIRVKSWENGTLVFEVENWDEDAQ